MNRTVPTHSRAIRTGPSASWSWPPGLGRVITLPARHPVRARRRRRRITPSPDWLEDRALPSSSIVNSISNLITVPAPLIGSIQTVPGPRPAPDTEEDKRDNPHNPPPLGGSANSGAGLTDGDSPGLTASASPLSESTFASAMILAPSRRSSTNLLTSEPQGPVKGDRDTQASDASRSTESTPPTDDVAPVSGGRGTPDAASHEGGQSPAPLGKQVAPDAASSGERAVPAPGERPTSVAAPSSDRVLPVSGERTTPDTAAHEGSQSQTPPGGPDAASHDGGASQAPPDERATLDAASLAGGQSLSPPGERTAPNAAPRSDQVLPASGEPMTPDAAPHEGGQSRTPPVGPDTASHEGGPPQSPPGQRPTSVAAPRSDQVLPAPGERTTPDAASHEGGPSVTPPGEPTTPDAPRSDRVIPGPGERPAPGTKPRGGNDQAAPERPGGTEDQTPEPIRAMEEPSSIAGSGVEGQSSGTVLNWSSASKAVLITALLALTAWQVSRWRNQRMDRKAVGTDRIRHAMESLSS
jgi:hypothetical protein